MSSNAIGFMSYVRADDEHDAGYLTDFRERLSGEVRAQTGMRFDIFQDRHDIAWGQNWRERIRDCIESVNFLICIITPSIFRSDACREEFERFVRLERAVGRSDLILPVYYIDSPLLNDEAQRMADAVASLVAMRNYVDWRNLRFEPLSSPAAKKMLARLASDIRLAMDSRPVEGDPGRRLAFDSVA
ncbi:toll/interleukin-1 receptor domain-containing protein [Massilia sp.]|uniref:toll/interleukin-1 receptor domain-containing protein n=1 Tax=Massilia sp. TaxID=1882437 RepID=UPI002897B3B8|nr:toll/interleukin-1 receptor domain-containing protein [Massilia sp.]